MPLLKVSNLSDLDAKVPSHLQRTCVSSLSLTSDPSHRCVKAKVIHKGPMVSCARKDGIKMLRAQVREEDPLHSTTEHTSIIVIFFGSLAKDFSQSVKENDVLLLTDFVIRNSPSFLKDKQHPCYLEIESQDACIYVCPSATPPAASSNSEAKYTYVPLNMLKSETVVSVYGVVTFFKQPFHSKGSDYYSTIKITDQSDVKVICTIFCKKLEDHPVILRVGDIIRLHRFKAGFFRDSMTLINSYGWSTVTFNGDLNSPIVPRTSSKSFHFGESDKCIVQKLRQWATDQPLLSKNTTIPLTSVQPGIYFDLTCQLLAKAVMDSCCILLKVWDGTRCEHPLLNVAAPSNALEGEDTVAKDQMNLTANVLVYDNHLEVARNLQPGMFVQFYNLHAIQQNTADQLGDQPNPLCFYLHKGTSYGRGLRSLPEDTPDVLLLKRQLEKHVDFNKGDVSDEKFLEIWYTPPEAVEAENGTEQSYTVRSCEHNTRELTLAQVKRCTPPFLCHVRARVKNYQPQELYQCLKLFCPTCKSMKDVPSDSAVAEIFGESASNNQPCVEEWAMSSSASSRDPGRTISMYISKDMVGESSHTELIFIQGTTLEEICILSHHYKTLVPVTSEDSRMILMDLSVPFLFSGEKRFYGCKQCSLNTFESTAFAGVQSWDEQSISEVLNVQLMQYRFLLQFELDDGTDTLEVLLWEDAEKFFHVSARDASGSQDLQDKVQSSMNRIQPLDNSLEDSPWMDICLSAYTIQDNNRNQICYQIINTEVRE